LVQALKILQKPREELHQGPGGRNKKQLVGKSKSLNLIPVGGGFVREPAAYRVYGGTKT